MRLDLYGLTSNIYGETSTQAASQASSAANHTAVSGGKQHSPRSAAEDTTSLSSNGSSVTELTRQALQTDPSRADRVALLKQAVSSSEYKLDAGKIADALANSDF